MDSYIFLSHQLLGCHVVHSPFVVFARGFNAKHSRLLELLFLDFGFVEFIFEAFVGSLFLPFPDLYCSWIIL